MSSQPYDYAFALAEGVSDLLVRELHGLHGLLRVGPLGR